MSECHVDRISVVGIAAGCTETDGLGRGNENLIAAAITGSTIHSASDARSTAAAAGAFLTARLASSGAIGRPLTATDDISTRSHRWFTLRSKYEHAQRRGKDLDEALLSSIGEQPTLRQYDVANRDRDRVTLIGSVTPTGSLMTSLTVAAGKDDYLQSLFGLRDNTHRVYGAGADYVVNDNVGFGLSYSYERYQALQRSRQANPGVQFDDPSRNWAADSTDRTHSLLATADVARIKDKIDLKVSYDCSRSRARYTYITGPVPDRTLPEEVPVPTTLPTPTELPPTLSEFHRGTVDVVCALTGRVSIGASYWYDRYRVSDFTLDIDANPELARGQALLMGYLYRPYAANTAWAPRVVPLVSAET